MLSRVIQVCTFGQNKKETIFLHILEKLLLCLEQIEEFWFKKK